MSKYVFGIDSGFAHTGICVCKVAEGGNKFGYPELYNEYGLTHIHSENIITEKSDKKYKIKVAHDDVRRISEVINRINVLYWNLFEEGDKILFSIEIPTGGSQSAPAARIMGYSISYTSTFTKLYEIPVVWGDPYDIKQALIGKKQGSKEACMDSAIKIFGGEKIKKGKNFVYKYDGKKFSKGYFEDIADALGACIYATGTEFYRILMEV